MIPEDELLDDLKRVADDHGNPTVDDYSRHGDYSPETIARRFDGWNNAKKQIGLDPIREVNDDDTLIEDIQRVADKVGQAPTVREYREHGNHGSRTQQYRFGSWNEAIKAAGFEPRREGMSKAEIPPDLLYELYYGEQMTTREIGSELGISSAVVVDRLDKYDIARIPKPMRYLVVNGPTPKEEFPYTPSKQILQLKLRKPVHSTESNRGQRYIGVVCYLPIHDPEEVVEVTFEAYGDDLMNYSDQTITQIFSGHGSDFKQASRKLRPDRQ